MLILMMRVCRPAAEFAAAAQQQQQQPAVADTAVQPASQQPEPQPGLLSRSTGFILLYHLTRVYRITIYLFQYRSVVRPNHILQHKQFRLLRHIFP